MLVGTGTLQENGTIVATCRREDTVRRFVAIRNQRPQLFSFL